MEGVMIALRDERMQKPLAKAAGRKTRVDIQAEGPSKELFGGSAGLSVPLAGGTMRRE